MTLNGSGASFPYQIYALWFMLYARDNPGAEVKYTPKGSGSGIKDFQAHKVDFGASDAAMSKEEIDKVGEEVLLLPVTAGEVAIAYNLPGIEQLNLPRQVYSDIFLGKISRWNDPVLAAANPDIQLPDLEITVVVRRDSSGTTFVFTKHLSAISAEFAERVGFGKKVDWPQQLKLERSAINAGISSTIRQTPGAIGYLDYGFATISRLPMAALENREGAFVMPGGGGGPAALAATPLPSDLVAWLPDPAGTGSYPITTYTWLLVYQKYQDPQKALLVRQMVLYFLDTGQRLAPKFGYIPLPPEVLSRVRAAALTIE